MTTEFAKDKDSEAALFRFAELNLQSKHAWQSYRPSDSSEAPAFRESLRNLLETRRHDAELLKFVNLKPFRNLKDRELLDVLEGHALLNAEAFIFFESLINVAFRRLSNDFEDARIKESVRKFLREEVLHSRGYRRFLAFERPLGWPGISLMIRPRKKLKAWMAQGIVWAPVAICFLAAKVEAYSVSYATGVIKDFGSPSSNNWTQVNCLHRQDESSHAPFQFDLYDYYLGGSSRGSVGQKILTPIIALAFFFCLQYLLLTSASRLIFLALKERGLLHRIAAVVAFSRWTVRSFEPYKLARQKTRRLFADKKPFMGWFYRFICW